VNRHIKQLIELSKIDKEVDAFDPQIEAVNHRYEATLSKKATLEQSIKELDLECAELQQKKVQNEHYLSELSDKLRENKKKASDIKTEKEMKSLQLEEEIAKEQISFANEEIVRLDKIEQSKQERLNELKNSLEELEQNVATIKQESDVQMAQIDLLRQEVFARKEALVSKMNQKGLSYYQKIRRWAKNSTAVPIHKKACMGCYIVVSDKVYNDAILGEEIVSCPHCGRILYVETSKESAA